MKVTEAVKSLIRRLNTCFQLVKKEVSCRSYENIAIRVANALGLPCFTVSKALTRARTVWFMYWFYVSIGATIFRVHYIEEK